MNLMNREKDAGRVDQRVGGSNLVHRSSQTLHQNTILAMSNLLNANIDTGLMFAIGKHLGGYLFLSRTIKALQL